MKQTKYKGDRDPLIEEYPYSKRDNSIFEPPPVVLNYVYATGIMLMSVSSWLFIASLVEGTVLTKLVGGVTVSIIQSCFLLIPLEVIITKNITKNQTIIHTMFFLLGLGMVWAPILILDGLEIPKDSYAYYTQHSIGLVIYMVVLLEGLQLMTSKHS